jgi:hypothetical protein
MGQNSPVLQSAEILTAPTMAATQPPQAKAHLDAPQQRRADGHLVCNAGPVSPFHDLGQRRGGSLPAENARNLPSSGPAPAAGGRPGANTELRVISVPRFLRLLSLGVLGLVGLLSFGVGGVVLVQGSVFRTPKVGIRELTGPSRHPEAAARSLEVRATRSGLPSGGDGLGGPEKRPGLLERRVVPDRIEGKAGEARGGVPERVSVGQARGFRD